MTETLVMVALMGGLALGFYVAGRWKYKPKIADLADELDHIKLKVQQLEARIKVKDMTIDEKSKALGGSDGPPVGRTGARGPMH